mgnify:CR=1 FL=1
MSGDDAVTLPERVRGSLLRGGKESDADWHARATEAATDALRGFQMKMREEKLDMDAKLNTAQSLQSLQQSYKTQLDAARETLSRLVSSLELADKGAEANAALEAYADLEGKILDGDLGVLKDAAGSPARIDKIVDIYDRVIPDGTAMTEEQARFDRALDLTLDAMADGKVAKRKDPVRIAIEARALPYVQKAIAHLAQDRVNPPFTSREDRLAFQAEIEGTLSEEQLVALRQGDETVLEDVLGDHLSQQQQLSLALAYFDHGDVDVDADVRRGVIERLVDAEYGQKHQDPGLRH